MKFIPVLVAIAVAVSSPALAASSHPKAAQAAAAGHIALPANVRPERYEITIKPDAEHLSFTGRETVSVVVKSATDRIVLNAADIAFRKVALTSAPRRPAGPHMAASHLIQAWTPKVVLDKTQQTAAFVFGKPLAPGRYSLSIDYSGVIYQQASGFFALDYAGQHGKQRALFTQFENSDARRLIPSWDEPGVKAVYSMTVEAPKGQMAVSNMPVAASAALANGDQSIRFADTPKMSSYLLFLAVGDFERIHRQVGKTDVGVVVRRGDTAKAQFALDTAAEILPFYNDYFGTPYPLPKLDFIAGPGRSQ